MLYNIFLQIKLRIVTESKAALFKLFQSVLYSVKQKWMYSISCFLEIILNVFLFFSPILTNQSFSVEHSEQ